MFHFEFHYSLSKLLNVFLKLVHIAARMWHHPSENAPLKVRIKVHLNFWLRSGFEWLPSVHSLDLLMCKWMKLRDVTSTMDRVQKKKFYTQRYKFGYYLSLLYSFPTTMSQEGRKKSALVFGYKIFCEKSHKKIRFVEKRQQKKGKIKSKEFNHKRFRFPTIVWFIHTIRFAFIVGWARKVFWLHTQSWRFPFIWTVGRDGHLCSVRLSTVVGLTANETFLCLLVSVFLMKSGATESSTLVGSMTIWILFLCRIASEEMADETKFIDHLNYNWR